MTSINSSGAVERFTLAAGESKTFETLPPGRNQFEVRLTGDVQETGAAVVTATEAAATNPAAGDESPGTFGALDVPFSKSVVPAGVVDGVIASSTRFVRLTNAGPALVHVVVKPSNRVQVVPAL